MTVFVCIIYMSVVIVVLTKHMTFDFHGSDRSIRSISNNFHMHSTYTGINGFTCFVCHPGFHYFKDCTLNYTTAVCKECAAGTYNSNFNIAYKCADCTTTCIDKNAEIVVRCNSTSDAICRCKSGFYNQSTGPGESRCLPHTKCEAGKEPFQQGTSTTDTKCRKCNEGYYSNSTSSTASCKRCKTCDPSGEVSSCSDTKNTVCVSDEEKSSFYEFELPFIIVAVLATAVAVAIIFYLYRNCYVCENKMICCRQNESAEQIKIKQRLGLCVEPNEAPSLLAPAPTTEHLSTTVNRTYMDNDGTHRDLWGKLFMSLGKELPCSKWKFVIRTLYGKYYKSNSVLENKVDTIIHDHQGNLVEQKYQCLLSWYRLAGDNACLRNIISALQSNDLTDLGEKLRRDFPSLL